MHRLENFFGAARWIIVIVLCLFAAGLLILCQTAARIANFVRHPCGRRVAQCD